MRICRETGDEKCMYRRKIMDELIAWKNVTGKKKALVIKGLRQVGKTYIVRAFAEENYEHVIYINFKNNESAKRIFDGDLSVDRITLDISALMPDAAFERGKTILIFDEVQECSNARAALKPFAEDGRFDVICTGSLLGIKGYNKRRGAGVPVGFEHIIYMYPMDFEEFLWAKGINGTVIDHIRECFMEKKPVSAAVHSAMLRNFYEYMCVGGMPYVVDRFLNTNDMNVVFREQMDLIEEYRDDFGKHLDENEREQTDLTLLGRINKVYDSIPAQLAKENKKFMYSNLEKRGRSENYQAAIQWLKDSGLISICYNLEIVSAPLEGNKIDNIFKLYMQDSGLFMAMLGQGSASAILAGELGMYKGAIFENIVADAFSKKGKKLYYFHKDSGLEIDFVSEVDGETALIEVKARNGNAKSANTVLKHTEKYDAKWLYKLSANNVGVDGNRITLPYYMAMYL